MRKADRRLAATPAETTRRRSGTGWLRRRSRLSGAKPEFGSSSGRWRQGNGPTRDEDNGGEDGGGGGDELDASEEVGRGGGDGDGPGGGGGGVAVAVEREVLPAPLAAISASPTCRPHRHSGRQLRPRPTPAPAAANSPSRSLVPSSLPRPPRPTASPRPRHVVPTVDAAGSYGRPSPRHATSLPAPTDAAFPQPLPRAFLAATASSPHRAPASPMPAPPSPPFTGTTVRWGREKGREKIEKGEKGRRKKG
uniref:Uncharacterized protein n=1 Tax=Oryza sativa subsp. japonica TaxID=39947 RepID=Q6ZL46_ORYSJ|nr:hypothetical protein [Oryza sativa Japonica Group]